MNYKTNTILLVFFCIIYCNSSVNFIVVYKINFSHFSTFPSFFSLFYLSLSGLSFLHAFPQNPAKYPCENDFLSASRSENSQTCFGLWHVRIAFEFCREDYFHSPEKMGLELNLLDNSSGLNRWSVAQLD